MLDNKLAEIRKKLQYTLNSVPQKFLFVDSNLQKMFLMYGDAVQKTYEISTSKFGLGNVEGSNKTPQGIHKIANKIGHSAPHGRIFESREDTGCDWDGDLTRDNMILSRILRLQGLEPGINQGPGIDSYERYIYIHGTNREDLIGTPNSHGCVCMRNDDVIDLFTIVEEDTVVIID
jgi:hypothetical protein